MIGLASCSDTKSSEDSLAAHGQSAFYIAGYHEGCPSGKNAGGDSFSQRALDNQANAVGNDYTTGWDYGFTTAAKPKSVNPPAPSARV